MRDWHCQVTCRFAARSPRASAREKGPNCAKHESLKTRHMHSRTSAIAAVTRIPEALAIEVLDVSKSFGDKQVIPEQPGIFVHLLTILSI